MKTINFYLASNPDLSWNPYTIRNAGLGGNYVAVWNLAKSLAKRGHEVTIYSHIHDEDIYVNVAVKDIRRLQIDKLQPDIFISCESGIPREITGKKINWIHRNVGDKIDIQDFDSHVFASDFHKEYLESEGEVIPNGVDIELFRPNKNKLEYDVTFVGHPIKGMQYIPEVVSKVRETIPTINTHIYGNAEIWGWNNDDFIPLQKILIENRLKYHGRMGQGNLARYMSQSKVFLYPSTFQEPFGLAVLEGMACGCIPVVSEVGNVPELIKDCGFVIKGIPTDFGWTTQAAEKVVELLTDKDMFREYSQKCVARAKAYNWDIVAELWENIF